MKFPEEKDIATVDVETLYSNWQENHQILEYALEMVDLETFPFMASHGKENPGFNSWKQSEFPNSFWGNTKVPNNKEEAAAIFYSFLSSGISHATPSDFRVSAQRGELLGGIIVADFGHNTQLRDEHFRRESPEISNWRLTTINGLDKQQQQDFIKLVRNLEPRGLGVMSAGEISASFLNKNLDRGVKFLEYKLADFPNLEIVAANLPVNHPETKMGICARLDVLTIVQKMLPELSLRFKI